MNQRKPNRIVWYSLGLVLLLCAATLVTSTGTAFARYRTEREADITFEVRSPAQISLGTVLEDGSFSTADPKWVVSSNAAQLDLAVANGKSTAERDHSQEDQQISVRMIGSLGLTDAAKVYLYLPGENETAETTKLQATATPIAEDTALYRTHGAGWIYTFQDTEGEELFWILEGGKLDFVSFTVTIENTVSNIDSLLQTQIVGKVIDE